MKRLLWVLTALLLCAMLCSCSRNVNTEDATEVPQDIQEANIINLQMREADTLDPITTLRQSVRGVLLVAYEPLFNINENFGAEAVLAQNYAFNDNATVMSLKIKEGVMWHNGQIFTSDDVIYTINRIKSNPNSSYYLNLETVDRVEKLNDYEIAFYLNKPNRGLIYSLYFPIVRVNFDISETIMGTGAYMLKEMDGKSLEFVRNPNWHMGQAECDGVKVVCMRTSAMAQEAFSSGKIHAVTKEMLDVENYAIKESNKKHIYPDGLFEFIGFNAESGLFTSNLLRVAVSNAVDRNAIGAIFSDGVPSGFPIMPGSSAFSPSYEMSEYNLDYAKEVIFSAGWIDIDDDSMPEKTVDGKVEKLEFSLLVADSEPLRSRVAEEIKTQLEKAGFIVKIDLVDIQTYEERISNGEYEAFLGAIYYDAPYDVAEILSSDGKVKYSGYSDREMDSAIAQFQAAADMENASVSFARLQSLYTAYQPVAGLVFRTSYVVTSKYVDGEIDPYPYSPYANIAKWKLKGIE